MCLLETHDIIWRQHICMSFPAGDRQTAEQGCRRAVFVEADSTPAALPARIAGEWRIEDRGRIAPYPLYQRIQICKTAGIRLYTVKPGSLLQLSGITVPPWPAASP